MLFRSTKHPGKIKAVIGLMILLVLGGLTVLFVDYRRGFEDTADLIRAIPEGADLSLNDIHQTATRDGKTQWRLDATAAHYLDAEKQVILKNPSMIFFTDDQQAIRLTADAGILMTETKDVIVNGNIELMHEKSRLVTDTLEYRSAEQMLFAKKPVTIFGDAYQLKAQSMVLDLTRNRAVLQGNVEGSFGEDLAL
jgi:LPS export ABC transporter protein LptC